MATSKHFLEQVKTGDVAAALQTALENAGSLKIVTHIAGEGSADDLPDSQKILTHIDAVSGTIETAVGEKFVQDASFKTLCEGHMQQVVAGCSSVRDNLDTIQALLDWVSEEPVAIDGSSTSQGGQESAFDGGFDGGAATTGMDAGTAGVAAAGLGAAAVGVAASASSPAEDSMLDVLETPAEEPFGDAVGLEEPQALDGLDGLESLDAGSLGSDPAGDNALLDDLNLDDSGSADALDLGDGLSLDDSGSAEALDLGDGLSLDGDAGLGDDLGLGGDLDVGGNAEAANLGADDLGFDLGSAAEGEDAGPETEFLMSDAGESTQLFGLDEATTEAPTPETPDFGDLGGDLGDAAAPLAEAGNDDPLAGLELGADLGGDAASDDPFNLDVGGAVDAPNLEEDTLAGVSWAESGSGEADLGLGGLELGEDTAPDAAAPDPEVDDLALDAIGDFDSGMWEEASAETVDIQEGESSAKVSRSLESLFSADDEGNSAPSAEGEASSGDPLSALFSDTSLDDIPSEPAEGGDSQETLAANPFEIDDLENDPFADLMLDDQNG